MGPNRQRPYKSVATKSRPDKTLFTLAWRDRTAMVAVCPELSRKLNIGAQSRGEPGRREGEPRGKGTAKEVRWQGRSEQISRTGGNAAATALSFHFRIRSFFLGWCFLFLFLFYL